MRILDSRDLLEELKELEESLEFFIEEGGKEEDFEDLDRIDALKCLQEEIGEEDFEFGATLIPENDFEEYAQEFAEDVYDIPDTFAFYIDWEKFANDMQMDYSSTEFDGETYWWR